MGGFDKWVERNRSSNKDKTPTRKSARNLNYPNQKVIDDNRDNSFDKDNLDNFRDNEDNYIQQYKQ